MKKRTIVTKKAMYRIGMNDEKVFTIEKWIGIDDDFNDVWSKEWLLASWCDDVIKFIAKYADKNALIG